MPQEPDHAAPPGASCALHPERPAVFTCPRCGSYACVFCWHEVSKRCEACLRRDPTSAAPPVPWETPGPLPRRFFATLGQAFGPTHTAPAFANAQLRPAVIFFLLTALPCAALAGIIPNTKTLLFGSSLSIVVQGKPSSNDIIIDIVLAMLMQIGAFALDLAALGAPYLSLVQSYAPGRSRAAWRVLLYRAWLVPFSTLTFFVTLWCLPAAFSATDAAQASPFLSLLVTAQFVFNVMLLLGMRATARLACGIGPVLSYVIVIVALVVRVLAQLLVDAVTHGALPKT